MLAAEIAAGVSISYFNSIRRGVYPYSEKVEAKVKAALAGKPIPKEKNMNEIPETCPPIIAELIKFKGSKTAAIKALGTSDGTFYGVLKGAKMPAAWSSRAKAAMGHSVIAAPASQPAAPSQPQIPEFVPWDGKSKITVELRPQGGKKKGRVVKVPEPLGRLIQMHPNMSVMAQSVGHTSGAFTSMIADSSKFSEKWQRKVHRALHGLPPENAPTMGEGYDKYQTGFAIVMTSATGFDRITDIADILNGQLVFKKHTKSGWIFIYRMADEDLPKFKRLALRDANEIVCP